MGLNCRKMVFCLFDIILVSTIVLSSIFSTLILTDYIAIETSSKFENTEKEFTTNIARRHCADFAVRNNIVFASIGGDLRYLYLDNLSGFHSYFPPDGTSFISPEYFAQNSDKLIVSSDRGNNNTIHQIYFKNESIHLEKILSVNFTIIKMSLTESHLFLMGYNWYWHPHLLVYEMFNANDLILVANSTINHSVKEITMDEKRLYVITEEGNLALYEIKENYIIEFIFEYFFNDLRFLFSDNAFIYTCDVDGLKIFETFENTRIKSVCYFSFNNVKSVFAKDNIIYLISARELLTLNRTDNTSVKELDKHKMNRRVNLEYKLITIYNQSCIILNEFYESQHEITTYTGPIFIFDVTNPENIIRVYPDKITFNIGLGMMPILLVSSIICSFFSCVCIVGVIQKLRKRRIENETISWTRAE